MPARSLLQMAQKVCIRDVKYLESVGDLPLKIDGAYGAIKPVLWAVERPEQLRLIERNSPQIIGDDAELWIKLIQRDVDKYADQMPPQPRNPDHWYNIYRKLVKEHQKDMEKQAAELKATMANLRDAKQKNQVQTIKKEELPKLPKLEGMQNLRLRDWNLPAAMAKKTRAGQRRNEETNKGTAGQKTKNIFAKLRKEKKVASRSTMSTPTHLLHNNLNRKTIVDQRSRAGVSQNRKATDVSRLDGMPGSPSSGLSTANTTALPRTRIPDEQPPQKMMKKKAPADVFMPQKRRRIS